MRILRPLIFSLITIASLVSCSSWVKQKCSVGIDPTFYPIDVAGKSAQVYAYTMDVLEHIAHKNHLDLTIVSRSWDNVALGLEKGEYDLMVTSLLPYAFNTSTYNLSEVFLNTSYVLVISSQDNFLSLEDIPQGKVAVQALSSASILVQQHPKLIPSYYNNIRVALEELSQGQCVAALIPRLQAEELIPNFYSTQLKIVGKPLEDYGLRVASLVKEKKFIEMFNHSIEKMQKDGTLESLQKKWKI